METIIVNAQEWQALVHKIDRITTFVEQYMKRLPTDDNVWLNEKEVCNLLKVSSRTLQRLRTRGDISFSTIATKHFYKAGSIRELLEKKSVKSRKEQIEALRNAHRKRI
jgi:3-methyladenine DNA glycosylase Tag